jgi:hypothetical protein
VTRSGCICKGDGLRLTEPRSEIKALPNIRERHGLKSSITSLLIYSGFCAIVPKVIDPDAVHRAE